MVPRDRGFSQKGAFHDIPQREGHEAVGFSRGVLKVEAKTGPGGRRRQDRFGIGGSVSMGGKPDQDSGLLLDPLDKFVEQLAFAACAVRVKSLSCYGEM